MQEAVIRSLRQRSKKKKFNISPVIECEATGNDGVKKSKMFNVYHLFKEAGMDQYAERLRTNFLLMTECDLAKMEASK